MPFALPTELPESTLLAQLRRNGSYVDCFSLTVPIAATQAEFIVSVQSAHLEDRLCA
jgi:hypothetical protein